MAMSNSKLSYSIKTGEAVNTEEFIIKKTDQGYRIVSGDTIWELDDSLSQTFWKYGETETNNYTARREKGRIYLEGFFKGENVQKEYNVDTTPWSQCAHFSLQRFVKSPALEAFYYFISPHDLVQFKIKAVKMETGTIVINTIPEQVIHIRIRPTGFAGNFWHGDYWFREKDGLYVRYEAVHGPPGTPVTVKKILSVM